MIERAKLQKFMERISSTMPSDSGSQAGYDKGANDLYAARHILFKFPDAPSPAAKDSVRRKAESVRAQITAANFGALAKQYSDDPGSKERGGELGVFQRGIMVKPFGDAVAALKPGEISNVVESDFGFHIIQRNTWDQIKGQYAQQSGDRTRQHAESVYIAQAQAVAKVQVKDNAVSAHEGAREGSDLASQRQGRHRDLDRRRLHRRKARECDHVRSACPAAHAADPAGARLGRADVREADGGARGAHQARRQREDGPHAGGVRQPASRLRAGGCDDVAGIAHRSQVARRFSAKTPAERERLAAARIEAFLDKVMAGEAQPVPVPAPLQIVLMNKYESKVNPAGIDRAVERAQKLRTVADSTRAANQPKSAVPLPGGAAPGAGAPGAQAPAHEPSQHAPAQPAPAQPAPAKP